MKKHSIFLLVALCLGVCFVGVFITKHNQPSAEQNNFVPGRVISINPAATEIIFKLGSEEKLIAISNFCNYPPETENIDKIGGVINPNFERISVLNPDLIIIQGQCDDIASFCQHKGIKYININLRNISEIYEGISELGQILGCPDAAEKLCEKIEAELESVKQNLSTAEKKKVFFSLYRTPGTLASITSVGPDTFLGELIEIAGGENIFSDIGQDYPVISKETLMKRQPDIIIEPYSHSAGENCDPNDALKDWSKLGKLDAVINKKLYVIDGDLVLKPGPRVGQAALKLARLIHPELFDE
jgi:iron complex transport system substrate-binding protein